MPEKFGHMCFMSNLFLLSIKIKRATCIQIIVPLIKSFSYLYKIKLITVKEVTSINEQELVQSKTEPRSQNQMGNN